MVLHIGKNIFLDKNEIISIIDWKTIEKNKYNKDLIEKFRKDKLIINDNKDHIRSYILANCKKNKYILYASDISTTSLLRRINGDIDIEGKVIF